jgi:hypothetical protein
LQTATPTVVWTLDGKIGSADRMSHLRSGQIDYAISVQVGLPHLLEYAIAELGLQCPVILCDVPNLTNETYYLFEAPATLSFPAAISGRALVSALVLRPGKKGAHLALSRVFQLPDDIEVVIHEIEGILRRHVDQWISQHQLWSGPAEQLLPDEVYSSDSVSRGNSDASLTTY